MKNESPSQRLAEVLEKEIPESRIARTLSECMSAVSISRSGAVEPDYRTRLAAAQLALSYKIGKPVERAEVVQLNLGADDAPDLSARLAHSPALREAFRKMLAEAVGSQPAIDA